MKLKKITAILAVAAIAITGVVGGCGSNQGQSTESAPEAEWDGNYNSEDRIITSQGYDKLEASYRGTNTTGMLIEQDVGVSTDEVALSKKNANSNIKTNAYLHGMGSAILVNGGSFSSTTGSIDTDASGAYGLYIMGNGNIDLTDTKVTTVSDYSGGIGARSVEDGVPFVMLEHAIVETGGRRSPGLMLRGESSASINDSYINSKGKDSPAVDLNGSLTATETTFESNASEVLTLNAGASVWVEGCTLSANRKGSNKNGFKWGILLHNSGEEGLTNEYDETELTLVGGKYINENGGMFYVTNTTGRLFLDSVELEAHEDADFLIRVSGNALEWGKEGENGGDLHTEFSQLTAEGDVVCDAISSLELQIYNDSVWTGAIKTDNSLAGGKEGNGTVKLTVIGGSTWVVTESCEISSFTGQGTLVDKDGKSVSLVGTDGTVFVQGDSDIKVTTAEYNPEDVF